MAWEAALASVASTALGVAGSGKAAKAQKKAADKAAAISERNYQRTRRDIAPYMSAGYAALAEQRKQLGLGDYNPSDVSGVDPLLEPTDEKIGDNRVFVDVYTGDAYKIGRSGANKGQYTPLNRKIAGYTPRARPGSTPGDANTPSAGGRYGAFEASPGYSFVRDEGFRAQDNAQRARGRFYSGAALREAARYATGLASTEYDKYFSRLSQLAGNGQDATSRTSIFGAENANNASTSALLSGASRASGIANQYDIYGQGVRDLGGFLGEWSRNRRSSSGSTGYDWDAAGGYT